MCCELYMNQAINTLLVQMREIDSNKGKKHKRGRPDRDDNEAGAAVKRKKRY